LVNITISFFRFFSFVVSFCPTQTFLIAEIAK